MVLYYPTSQYCPAEAVKAVSSNSVIMFSSSSVMTVMECNVSSFLREESHMEAIIHVCHNFDVSSSFLLSFYSFIVLIVGKE